MSRTIPAAILSALAQPSVELFYAIELNFNTAPVRLWTGFGDRVIDGQTYIGAGTLLSISGIEEVADLSAKGITLTLSGVDVSLVSLALQEPYQGRTARVLFGAENSIVNQWVLSDGVWDDNKIWVDEAIWKDDNSVVYNFVEVFAGLMDVMTLQEDGSKATIELTVESKLVTLQRPNIRRYTSENQKLRYPTDTFLDYVEQLQDKEIAWGRKIA